MPRAEFSSSSTNWEFVCSRFMLGMLVVLALLLSIGTQLARGYAPILKAATEFFSPTHRIVELSLADEGAIGGHDRMFRAVFAPTKTIVVGDRSIPAHPAARVTITVLTAYLWQPFMVTLPLAFAWPCKKTSSFLFRLSALFPLLFLISLIDLPLVLCAEVWEVYLDTFDRNQSSLLLGWRDFLQNGGRYVLGIVTAAIAIMCSDWFNEVSSARKLEGS